MHRRLRGAHPCGVFKGGAQRTRLMKPLIAYSLLIGISLALPTHFMPE
jgi:hypothetical protein